MFHVKHFAFYRNRLGRFSTIASKFDAN